MEPYSPEIEQAMKKYYATLSEKDRRRYAAIEALKLGHGGQSYISGLLGCSEKTVSRGLVELEEMPERPEYEASQGKAGGGRHGYDKSHPDIDAQFLEVLKEHTAGDPMDEQIVWTDLTPQLISLSMFIKLDAKSQKTSKPTCVSFLTPFYLAGTIVSFQIRLLFNPYS